MTSPSPSPRDMQDVDIDLGLVPPNRPGYARRPDLIVVEAGTVDRADDEGRLIRASEVILVVEIVSPGSVRMDNAIKHRLLRQRDAARSG